MSNVRSYFDTHQHHHAYHRDPASYAKIVEEIKTKFKHTSIRVLDLGCGDGSFIKALKLNGINGSFIGVDLSEQMVANAKLELKDYSSYLLVGDGFNLPIIDEIHFDLIHLDSVLHHLISKNRAESKHLTRKLLKLVKGLLSNEGMIIVEEMYYMSFLSPNFTSGIIFYGLKFMNKFRINLSVLSNEFQPGLEVNFYSEKILEDMFKDHWNSVTKISRNPSPIPNAFRLFLLRQRGRVSYSLT